MPARFWRRTGRPKHPFHRHALLARHGGELSRAAKRHLTSRAWPKRVVPIPGLHYVQTFWLLARVALAERGRKPQLIRLAKQAAAMIWGIEEERLEAAITTNVAFGNLSRPKTAVGRFAQAGAAGYGGVRRDEGKFTVVAKAWNWPLVLHELVKGVAELVCLHGLNELDDATYKAVTDEADQIEYEPWLLQAGPEMWRRFLAVLPAGRPLAEMLMHVARLEPQPLEDLMLAVIEAPEKAKRWMARLD
jgi:hypothetical protein